jgi:hypothetical protein
MYMLFDNCRDRWQLGGEWLVDHPTEKSVPEKPNKEEREKNPGMDLRMWTSKYTSNDKGQTKTGWTAAAFKERKRILGVFQEAMTKDNEPAILEFERKVLPKVTAAMLEPEEGDGKPKRKKRKIAAAPKVVPMVDLAEFSDDEEVDLTEVEEEEV